MNEPIAQAADSAGRSRAAGARKLSYRGDRIARRPDAAHAEAWRSVRACSTSSGDLRGGATGARRPLSSGHALPLAPRAADRRHGAAAARLGHARRQWRARRRSRQCGSPRRRRKVWLQRDTHPCQPGSNSFGTPPATSGSACAASTPSASRSRLDLAFDADFADLFEVRGDRAPQRGGAHVAVVDERHGRRFTYRRARRRRRGRPRCISIRRRTGSTEHSARWDDGPRRAGRIRRRREDRAARSTTASAEPPHIARRLPQVRTQRTRAASQPARRHRQRQRRCSTRCSTAPRRTSTCW